MSDGISRGTIERISSLAQLSLTEEEIAQAACDMKEVIDFMSCLQEVDTEGVEPMSHVLPLTNGYREDIVTNGDGQEDVLKNAPAREAGFLVSTRV